MIGDFFTEDALTMTLDIPQIIGYTHYINFFLGVEQHNPTNLSIVLPIKLIYHKKKKNASRTVGDTIRNLSDIAKT